MLRTQIYLDEAQTSRLDEEARASGRTRSELIRDAISAYLARGDRATADVVARQKDALLAAFGAEPGLADSDAELRAADRRRARDLEQRWDTPK